MVYAAANPIIKANGLGWSDPKAYETQTDLIMRYVAKLGDKRPTTDSMMTNRFVGGVKVSAAEFDQMKKNSKDFRTYVT
jgi:hypothetical protein